MKLKREIRVSLVRFASEVLDLSSGKAYKTIGEMLDEYSEEISKLIDDNKETK